MDEDMEIIELANRLKGAYSQYLLQSRRGKKELSPRDRQIAPWKRVAAVVRKLKADPLDYIEAQFKYSPSTIFVNALHGPAAQERYREYRKVKKLIIPEGEREKDVTDSELGEGEIKDRICSLRMLLSRLAGSYDLLDGGVREEVKKKKYIVDPLIIMLLHPRDEEYAALFGLQAKEELLSSPRLRRSAEKLGYDVATILAIDDYD